MSLSTLEGSFIGARVREQVINEMFNSEILMFCPLCPLSGISCCSVAVLFNTNHFSGSNIASRRVELDID